MSHSCPSPAFDCVILSLLTTSLHLICPPNSLKETARLSFGYFLQSKTIPKILDSEYFPKNNPRPALSHTDGPGGEIGDTLEQSRSNGRELLALIEVTWYLLSEHSEGFGGWAFEWQYHLKIWVSKQWDGFLSNCCHRMQAKYTLWKVSSFQALGEFLSGLLIRKVTTIAFNCCSGSVSFHAYCNSF